MLKHIQHTRGDSFNSICAHCDAECDAYWRHIQDACIQVGNGNCMLTDNLLLDH